eukprot:TRINITY_DN1050_c0_g1_i14.p1 TRINITY_DN1050_c0_g1~~TRINITY_DN1050_c0_g1_i14.p1  ORF type:complete len:183 (-),score=25.86 TRINITY_DN1050_c0_g1_i14:108-656(-)
MASDKQGKILRIVLHSLGSPSWGCLDPEGDVEILQLLHALRGLMRSSLAVCYVSVPSTIFSESFMTRARHICDTVVSIESFATILKEDISPIFQDFDGLFHVLKLPRVNTLNRHTLNCGTKLTFVVKRKKLRIEPICLPPEISRTTNKESETQLKEKQRKILEPPVSTVVCQPGPRSIVMDF